MALQELMDVIGFDDEDLDANRHGYMSKRQRVKLAHQSRLLALFNSPWKERHNNKFVKFAPVNIVLVANGLLWVLISVLMATNTSPGINADIAREITIALLPLIIIFIPSLVFGISAVIVDR